MNDHKGNPPRGCHVDTINSSSLGVLTDQFRCPQVKIFNNHKFEFLKSLNSFYGDGACAWEICRVHDKPMVRLILFLFVCRFYNKKTEEISSYSSFFSKIKFFEAYFWKQPNQTYYKWHLQFKCCLLKTRSWTHM